MARIYGNEGICVIVGDTMERRIAVDSGAVGALEGVVFTCKRLGLQREFVAQGDEWVLRFEAEETAKWGEVETTYDVTMRFVGSDGKAVVLSESGVAFVVKAKRNPVKG